MEGATRCRQWCWILLLLLLGLLQLNGQSDAYIYVRCDANKYSNGSEYESNVNAVLSHLVSIPALKDKFSTYSSGAVNGLVQCYALPQDCHNCYVAASQLAYQECPNAIGARIQLDFCFIRYENYSFASVLDTNVVYSLSNPKSSNDIQGFNETLGNLMEDLASTAIMPSSDGFATGSSVVINNRNVTIHGFEMCYPPFQNGRCFACLNKAIAALNQCCSSQVGGRVYLGSCSVQFMTYLSLPGPFYTHPSLP